VLAAAMDNGVPLGWAALFVVAVGVVAIMLYERSQMARLSPTARALILDERRRARRRPWTWRPQYVYMPWPVWLGRKVPSPIWLVVVSGLLVLAIVNYGEIGPGAPVIVGGLALLALLSAWHGPEGALIGNDEVAACVAAYPTRFAGLASVDLRRPVAAVRELRRCVRDLGAVPRGKPLPCHTTVQNFQ